MSVNNLIERALKESNRSNYLVAFNLYKDALSLIDAEKDKSTLLTTLMSIADTGRMTGNFVDSSTYYNQAIMLSRSQDNLEMTADAKIGLGLSQRALGYWKEALREFSDARDYYEDNGDTEGLAFCVWATAGAFRIKGDIPKTLKTFNEAHKMFRELDDPCGAAYCLCGLGGASRAIGQYKESLKYYQKANAQFTSISDRFGVAYSYCGIGNANRMIGKYDTAMEYLKKAMTVYEKIGDIVSSAYTLWSIGVIYLIDKKYSYSERYFIRALDYFKKTGDVRGEVYVGLGRSQVEFMKNNNNSAMDILMLAEKTAGDFSFSLEHCHALRIGEIIKDKERVSCYKLLGVKELGRTLPLNIP